MLELQVTFAVIALIMCGLSGREWLGNGKKMTLRGKIWFRMGLVFAVISAYLSWFGQA